MKIRLIYPILGFTSLMFVLVAWSVSSPVGSSPDDDYHLVSAYCAQGLRDGYCEKAPSDDTRLVPAGLVGVQDCFTSFDKSAKCQIDELARQEGLLEPTARLNTGDLYPKVFYRFASTFSQIAITSSAQHMRLANIFLIMVLFCATYLCCNQKYKRVLPIMWCVSSVPLGLFVFSSNNPSSWAVAGLTCYPWCALNLIDETTLRRRFAVLFPTSVSVLMALGSRNDSAMFLFLLTIVVAIYSYPNLITRTSKGILSILIFCSGSFVIYNFFFVSTRIVQQGFLVENLSIRGSDIFLSNLESLPNLLFGSFGYSGWNSNPAMGQLGSFNTPVPPLTTFLVLGVFTYLCSRSVSIWKAHMKLAVGTLWAMFILLPLYLHQTDRTLIGQFVQPRYFMALLFMILGLSILSSNLMNTSFSHLGTASMWAAMTIGHSLAFHLFIRRYASGYGGFGFNLNEGAEWWPHTFSSPMATWIIASISFGTFSAFAFSHLLPNGLTWPSRSSGKD